MLLPIFLTKPIKTLNIQPILHHIEFFTVNLTGNIMGKNVNLQRFANVLR